MRLRDSIALTLPSFFLRLILGLTFLWAGTGKLMGTMQVSGNDAARLANLGVVLDPVVHQPPAHAEPDQPMPETPLPDPTPQTAPETGTTDENPDDELQNRANEIIEKIQGASKPPASDENENQNKDQGENQSEVEVETSEDPAVELLSRGNDLTPRLIRVQHTSGDRTASDFPEPVECQRVYSIALMISKAGDPGLTEDSQPIRPIIPPKLADGHWPKTMAWAAAITEIVAGGFLILGLLTRISAMGTLGVMLVAMWMTHIGPAALHSTDAILGFIPNNQPWYAPGSYAILLWQVALAAMSLAVVFLGSGAIGLDRLFFSSQPRDPYLHGDPKAGKKQPMNPAAAQRSEFDRSPPPAN